MALLWGYCCGGMLAEEDCSRTLPEHARAYLHNNSTPTAAPSNTTQVITRTTDKIRRPWSRSTHNSPYRAYGGSRHQCRQAPTNDSAISCKYGVDWPTCVALPTKCFFRCNSKMRILLKPGFGRDQPHRAPFDALFTVTVLLTEAPK